MLPGARDKNGRLLVDIAGETAAPGSTRVQGILVRPDGAMYCRQAAMTQFVNGIPLTAAGRVSVDFNAAQIFLNGLGRIKLNGRLCIRVDQPILPNDTFVAGLRMTPDGCVHCCTALDANEVVLWEQAFDDGKFDLGLGQFIQGDQTTYLNRADDGPLIYVPPNSPRWPDARADDFGWYTTHLGGAPVITPVGVLMEPDVTNYIQYTGEMENWGTTNVTLDGKQLIGPDGKLSMVRATNTGTTVPRLFESAAIDSTLDVAQSVQVFVSKGTAAYAHVRLRKRDGTFAGVWVNTTSLDVEAQDPGVTNAEVIPSFNGTFLIRFNVGSGAGATALQMQCLSVATAGSTTGVIGQYSYWFGGSVYAAEYHPSYLPNGSAATNVRAADQLIFDPPPIPNTATIRTNLGNQSLTDWDGVVPPPAVPTVVYGVKVVQPAA